MHTESLLMGGRLQRFSWGRHLPPPSTDILMLHLEISIKQFVLVSDTYLTNFMRVTFFKWLLFAIVPHNQELILHSMFWVNKSVFKKKKQDDSEALKNWWFMTKAYKGENTHILLQVPSILKQRLMDKDGVTTHRQQHLYHNHIHVIDSISIKGWIWLSRRTFSIPFHHFIDLLAALQVFCCNIVMVWKFVPIDTNGCLSLSCVTA